MDEQPSTSKSSKNVHPQSPADDLPPELDITSDEFDPMQALYANPEVKLTKRRPKIIFQNMAAFEVEYSRKGLYGMSSRSKDSPKKGPSTDAKPSTSTSDRRFLPHQMAIQTTGIKVKNQRSLLKQIENMEGPMAVLRDCLQDGRMIKVYTRSEHGVRGTITGYLTSFDKHWNLLLRNVHETWKRRKYKYDQNKFCGTPSDCTDRLRVLGITVPTTKVKSLNRKNVELSRSIPQLMVRGEHIVLVIIKEKEGNEAEEGKA